jgi:hypothetical protein
MRYIATMNTPGYLPDADEPAVFTSAQDAWQYLREDRERDEEDEEMPEDELSEPLFSMRRYANTDHGPDTVYGDTPGYDGSHDLGIAYSVTQVPRGAGRCPCCGDDVAVMDDGFCCDDCTEEGCEQSTDAGGDTAYFECQRTDSLADVEEWCIEGHPVGNCGLCDTSTEPWYSQSE